MFYSYRETSRPLIFIRRIRLESNFPTEMINKNRQTDSAKLLAESIVEIISTTDKATTKCFIKAPC